MVTGPPVVLEDVPATALVPLWARACEADADEPLFRDEYALEALRELDFDFTLFESMSVLSKETTVVGTAVRTAQFDEKVQAFIANNRGGRIVNLGCGLDARSLRLDDGRTPWLEVDLPSMISLRMQLLEPSERRRMMGASMFDDTFFAALSAYDDRPLLILCEGVLLYFPQEDVEGMLVRLAQSVRRATVVFDVVGTALVDQHHPAVLAIGQDVPVQWGIDEHASLGELHPALHFEGYQSAYDRFPGRWRSLAELVPVLRERVGQGMVTMSIDASRVVEP